MQSKLNIEQLDKMRKDLDVKYPVEVRFHYMRYASARYKGLTYYFNLNGDGEFSYIHKITVTNDYRSSRELAEILLHELTHCKQKEKYGDFFGDMYWGQLKAVGLSDQAIAVGKPIDADYLQIRFEQEAMKSERIASRYTRGLLIQAEVKERKGRIRRYTECRLI